MSHIRTEYGVIVASGVHAGSVVAVRANYASAQLLLDTKRLDRSLDPYDREFVIQKRQVIIGDWEPVDPSEVD